MAVLPILLMMVVVIKLLSMICTDLAVFRCKEGDLLPEKMTLSQELQAMTRNRTRTRTRLKISLSFDAHFTGASPASLHYLRVTFRRAFKALPKK